MSIGTVRPANRLFFWSAWLAALAGPVAWAADLEAVYALAPRSCVSGRAMLHLVTFLGLAAAGLGALVAALNRASFGRAIDADDRGSAAAQIRFLSAIGLMSNPLFSLIIVAQWLAILLLDPCSPP